MQYRKAGATFCTREWHLQSLQYLAWRARNKRAKKTGFNFTHKQQIMQKVFTTTYHYAKRLGDDADMMTPQKAKELFILRDDGQLVWRVSTSYRSIAGNIAGTINNNGYRCISVKCKIYLAHRIVWLMIHGEFPTIQIDHINGNKLDNRISNLREATHKQNQQNKIKPQSDNKIGFLGVHFNKSGKFRAQICVNKKNKHLGMFDTAKEAHEAYLKAKRQHHEFCTI